MTRSHTRPPPTAIDIQFHLILRHSILHVSISNRSGFAVLSFTFRVEIIFSDGVVVQKTSSQANWDVEETDQFTKFGFAISKATEK